MQITEPDYLERTTEIAKEPVQLENDTAQQRRTLIVAETGRATAQRQRTPKVAKPTLLTAWSYMQAEELCTRSVADQRTRKLMENLAVNAAQIQTTGQHQTVELSERRFTTRQQTMNEVQMTGKAQNTEERFTDGSELMQATNVQVNATSHVQGVLTKWKTEQMNYLLNLRA
jgi:hypothetical protein